MSSSGRIQKITGNAANGFELQCENGLWRIQFLENAIIRAQYSVFENIVALRDWNPVAVHNIFKTVVPKTNESETHFTLQTDELLLRIEKSSGLFQYCNASGRVIFSDKTAVRSAEIDLTQCKIPLYPGDEQLPPTAEARTQLVLTKYLNEDESYFGLGQRALVTLDRRGERLTNWAVDPAPGHSHKHDNLYQSHPVFMALNSAEAWGFYVNTTWYNQWDVGLKQHETMEIAVHGGSIDSYFIYGPTPAKFLEKLTGLTGKPMLPPLWGYGYHQCRWSYFTDTEVREVASGFRSRGIPLDVIHLDIDYMDGYRCFTWNPKTFSNPKKLIDDLAEQHIRAITIIDPGIKHEFGGRYETAEQLAKLGGYIRDKYNSPIVGNVWPDRVLFPDFTREDVRSWWGERHTALTEVGVAGIWQDMNEPANFDRPFSEESSSIRQRPMPLDAIHGKDEIVYHSEVHNAYAYLMCRATYEGLCKLKPNLRPWTLTRAGLTGSQKYAMAWMGDNSSWWEHLEVSIQQAISMGLCGMPNIGVDIGGFWENCNPELYARWIQLGSYYPFMRTHSDLHSNRQEPWLFGPEVEAIAKKAIERRYELLPYLYSTAFQMHESGSPIVRPMFFEHASDKKTWRLATQFMFGPDICVAPIVRPGESSRAVYLPGDNWFLFGTNQCLKGGQSHLAEAPLDHIPVYVRAGAVIPMGNVRQSTMQPLTRLTFHAYPAQLSIPRQSFLYFEDDGVSFDYQKGMGRRTQLSCRREANKLIVKIDDKNQTQASYEQVLRVYAPVQPQSISLNANPVTNWKWLASEGAAEFVLPSETCIQVECIL